MSVTEVKSQHCHMLTQIDHSCNSFDIGCDSGCNCLDWDWTFLTCLDIELGSCHNYIHSPAMLLGTPVQLIMQISNRPVKVH